MHGVTEYFYMAKNIMLVTSVIKFAIVPPINLHSNNTLGKTIIEAITMAKPKGITKINKFMP